MDVQSALEITEGLIGRVGFPIGVAIALLINSMFTQRKLSNQMQKLTESVEQLTKQLADVLVKVASGK